MPCGSTAASQVLQLASPPGFLHLRFLNLSTMTQTVGVPRDSLRGLRVSTCYGIHELVSMTALLLKGKVVAEIGRIP